jgi:hypothetical protein
MPGLVPGIHAATPPPMSKFFGAAWLAGTYPRIKSGDAHDARKNGRWIAGY